MYKNADDFDTHVSELLPGAVLLCSPSADRYGSDKVLLAVATSLDGAGWDVTITAPTSWPDIVDNIPSASFRVAEVPVLRKASLGIRGVLSQVSDLPRGLITALREIRTVDPDLVYVNTIAQPVWVIAAALLRRRTIVHVHEIESAQPGLVSALLLSPLHLADRIIVISDAVLQYALRYTRLPRQRFRRIYNSVPEPNPAMSCRGTTKAPIEAELAETTVRIGVIGRLSPRKGQDVALRALEILLTDGYDVCLLLAGTTYPGYEWYEAELKRLISDFSLDPHVSFEGYVPASEFFPSVNITVVPSRQEPFGLVAAESQSWGRPTIVSGVEGLLEIVEHGVSGWVFETEDPMSLAEAIRSVISDPSTASRISQNGRGKARSSFGMSRFQREIQAAVDETVLRRKK